MLERVAQPHRISVVQTRNAPDAAGRQLFQLERKRPSASKQSNNALCFGRHEAQSLCHIFGGQSEQHARLLQIRIMYFSRQRIPFL